MRMIPLMAVVMLGASAPTSGAEVVKKSISLFGLATMEQTIVYEPTEADYKTAYDAKRRALAAGDTSACVNSGPWMQVMTEAMVGISVRGFSVLEGREHVRQVSAAEHALFDLVAERKPVPCG